MVVLLAHNDKRFRTSGRFLAPVSGKQLIVNQRVIERKSLNILESCAFLASAPLNCVTDG